MANDFITNLIQRFAPERKEAASVFDFPDVLRGRTGWRSTGKLDDPEQAIGLPAVWWAISTIVEAAITLPIHVYSTGEPRQRRDDTPQGKMLRRRPAPDMSPTEWRSDMLAALLGYGNFYARKVRGGGRVIYLIPYDPATVSANWENGRVIYRATHPVTGKPEELTSRDVFHVRGITLRGQAQGLSPITCARLAFGTGMALEEYVNAFYRNDATPGGYLSFPQEIKGPKAERILEVWNETYGGVGNKGKTALLGGGAEYRTIGMTLADAQFAEHRRLTVEDTARLFRIPLAMANGDTNPRTLEAFLKLTLGPWLRRIEDALNTDDDIFPVESGLFCEHLIDALMWADPLTRWRTHKEARQSGALTANEIRAMENLPPHPDGDRLQVTPVGGAPNRDDESDSERDDEGAAQDDLDNDED